VYLASAFLRGSLFLLFIQDFFLLLPPEFLQVGPHDADQSMVILFIFQEIIDFGTVEDHGHAEIHPGQQDHDTGHASVDIGKVAEVVHVQSTELGYKDPAQGCDDGSGILLPEIAFPGRDKPVDPHEDEDQDHESDDGTPVDHQRSHGFQQREPVHDEMVELISEYPEKEHGHDHQGEQQGVQEAEGPEYEEVPVILDIVYGVQSFNDGVDPLGGGPEGQDDGDREHGVAGLMVDLVDDAHDQGVALKGDQLCQYILYIPFGKGQKFGQSQEKDHKGDERQEDKESGHGAERRDMILIAFLVEVKDQQPKIFQSSSGKVFL